MVQGGSGRGGPGRGGSRPSNERFDVVESVTPGPKVPTQDRQACLLMEQVAGACITLLVRCSTISWHWRTARQRVMFSSPSCHSLTVARGLSTASRRVPSTVVRVSVAGAGRWDDRRLVVWGEKWSTRLIGVLHQRLYMA